MAADQITYDAAYDTVDRDDFPAMMVTARYGRRSDAFDRIISQTHDHFWDPLDPTYIDFSQPFDMTTTPILPLENIMGHSDVDVRTFTCGGQSYKKKMDPGDNFPWAQVRAALAETPRLVTPPKAAVRPHR